MNSLGAPVDSLALDYLGFSFFPVVINNVWAWVAVITAAVSFWGIRAVSPVALKSEREEKPSPEILVSPPPHTEEEKEAVAEPVPVAALASSTTTASLTRAPTLNFPLVDVDATTRGKFTVYYEDESEGEAAWEGEVDDDGGVVEVGGGGGGYWCDNWEKVMRMRMEGGDKVWYRYQDLTVFDGNVVRLWDGRRDKSNISLY